MVQQTNEKGREDQLEAEHRHKTRAADDAGQGVALDFAKRQFVPRDQRVKSGRDPEHDKRDADRQHAFEGEEAAKRVERRLDGQQAGMLADDPATPRTARIAPRYWSPRRSGSV